MDQTRAKLFLLPRTKASVSSPRTQRLTYVTMGRLRISEDTSELVGKARTVQQERKAQKLREDHLSLKQPVKAEATRVTGKEECEQLLERLRSEVREV